MRCLAKFGTLKFGHRKNW